MRNNAFIRLGLGFLALVISTTAASAQATAEQNGPAKQADVFENLKFRNLGPSVAGGRIAAVVGIPGKPNIYYVGAAGGGVFKTENGGNSWEAIFEHEKTSSIGALAIDPSNPNLIWVGTGEANIRNDITNGDGVYFSPDAGHSWKFMGLGEAGQISSVIVDPHDSNTVLVGALGHAWGPNPERGVFRTTDGGKNWTKVLYVDDSTGVTDLAMQPGNPKVLFAAMWHARRLPWTLVDGGATSGIYRSTDGGDHWTKLTEGLPEGPLGRIALAIAPTNPNHLYALVAAKKGMLWESTDLGDHWTAVTDNHALSVRPFYFSRMVVSPVNEKKIYFLSYELLESTDGGKTARYIDRGVHVDHHAIWIDPMDPDRIIQGNDGGVYLSTDGAKSWRFLDNIPIGQLYQVAVDSSTPYNICGGLQDNSGWCGPSNNLGGRGVTGDVWTIVVGGDGEYIVPAPSDPNIIYGDSQSASIIRLDKATHLSRRIRPYLDTVQQLKPADLKYRFNWTSPIDVSATDSNEVYLGGNVIFKTTDGGEHWTPISPDLTRNDKSKQEIAGGPVHHDISGAETYDTILAVTLAPTDPKVIWVGTDDGLVQMTRDGGKSWTNVTPNIHGAPEWARVYQVDVSPFDAGTAYVAYNAHMLDDRKPYVYRTSDYGKTWTPIMEGLPGNVPAHVVREDPNQKGLLVLGTDTGLYYSQDSGAHWKPIKSNFPTVPVWDLKFDKNSRDLVVATHGRGIFVFDNIRALEELTSTVEASDFHLFSSRPGTHFLRWRSGGGSGGFSAPNPPDSVVIDYYLKSEIKTSDAQKQRGETAVKIVITNSRGNPVATEYGPAKAGINRFVWRMRYDGPTKLAFTRQESGEEENPFRQTSGRVPPGTYKVAATVNGKTENLTATVLPDPNVKLPQEEFVAAAKAALSARSELNALREALNRIDAMQKQLQSFEKSVRGNADQETKYASILSQGKDLGEKLKALKDEAYDPRIQHDVTQDSIHELDDFEDKVSGLASATAGLFGEAPNALLLERAEGLRKELNTYLEKFNSLLKTEVAAYNKSAYGAGAPTVLAGDPVTVKTPVGP